MYAWGKALLDERDDYTNQRTRLFFRCLVQINDQLGVVEVYVMQYDITSASLVTVSNSDPLKSHSSSAVLPGGQ